MKVPELGFFSDDLITLHGTPYRWLEKDRQGQTFQSVTDPGIKETYSHEKLWALKESEHYEYHRGYFSGATAFVRRVSGLNDLSSCTAEEIKGMLYWTAWAEAFIALYEKKEVYRTEPSISDPTVNAKIKDLANQMLNAKAASLKHQARASVTAYVETKDFKVPCPRKLLGCVRAYERAGGNPLVFRSFTHRSGNCKPRFDEETAALLALTVHKYADPRRPSMAKVLKDVEGAFEIRNAERKNQGLPLLPIPGRKAVASAIGRLDPFYVRARRMSIDIVKRAMALAGGRIVHDEIGLRIEIDEWDVDFQSIFVTSGVWDLLTPDERNEVERGRYTLTVAIDGTTRVILGMRLSKTPSTDSALAVLGMASRAKAEFADAVGALSSWHQYAPPKAIVTDWGAPYISDRFKTAVEDVGATKEFPPTGWPAHRPFIERWFGTAASQLASRMHGKVFSNVVLRGEYPSESLAWLTSDETAYVLMRYVIDAYHNSPHEGLNGETPYECYERIVLERGIDAPIGPHRRRVCFGQIHSVTPTNRGVRFLGNFYSCPELAHAWLHSTQRHYEIRVDLENLGAVSIKIGEAFYPAKCRTRDMDRVTATNWIAANRAARRTFRAAARLARSIVLSTLRDIEVLNDGSLRRGNIAAPLPSIAEVSQAEQELFWGYELVDDSCSDAESDTQGEAEFIGEVIPPVELASELHRQGREQGVDKAASRGRKQSRPAPPLLDSGGDDDEWRTT